VNKLALPALAVVAALAIVGGCSKKTTPAANSAITEVTPPQPVHNGITPAAPISYAEPMVAPVDYGPVSAPSGGKTYIVKRGDTLWGLAQRTYGDGKQYRKILAANPNIKGEQLNVGQKIVIPS
jgi:5'-nucleotidase